MGGVVGSLFGSDEGSTQTTTTLATLPSWIKGPIQDIVSRTSELSERPYEAFTGQRIADLTPDEQRAFQLTRQLQEGVNLDPSKQITQEVARRGLEGYTQEELQPYMNPYIENVLDVGRRRQFENFDRQMRDYRSRAGQASAFGGSRFGLGEAEMSRRFQEQLADFETEGLYNAFQQGLAGAQAGTQLAGQSATDLANMLNLEQQSGLQAISALERAGQRQRGLEQAGLDIDYEDFIKEQAYPYQQLQFASGQLYPVGSLMRGQTQTREVQSTGGPGILGNALGLASMASSIPGIGNMFSSISGSAANTPMLFGGSENMGGGTGNYFGNIGSSIGGGSPFSGGGGAPTNAPIPMRRPAFAEGGRVKLAEEKEENEKDKKGLFGLLAEQPSMSITPLNPGNTLPAPAASGSSGGILGGLAGGGLGNLGGGQPQQGGGEEDEGGFFGRLIGTAIGAYVGGPTGATIGAQVGSKLPFAEGGEVGLARGLQNFFQDFPVTRQQQSNLANKMLSPQAQQNIQSASQDPMVDNVRQLLQGNFLQPQARPPVETNIEGILRQSRNLGTLGANILALPSAGLKTLGNTNIDPKQLTNITMDQIADMSFEDQQKLNELLNQQLKQTQTATATEAKGTKEVAREKQKAQQAAKAMQDIINAQKQGTRILPAQGRNEEERKEKQVNMPLFEFGARLMASRNNFFKAIGEAGLQSATTMKQERQMEALRQQQEAEQQMDQIKTALQSQRVAAEMQRLNDPYTRELKRLEMAKLMQDLDKDSRTIDKDLMSLAEAWVESGRVSDINTALAEVQAALQNVRGGGQQGTALTPEEAALQELNRLRQEME